MPWKTFSISACIDSVVLSLGIRRSSFRLMVLYVADVLTICRNYPINLMVRVQLTIGWIRKCIHKAWEMVNIHAHYNKLNTVLNISFICTAIANRITTHVIWVFNWQLNSQQMSGSKEQYESTWILNDKIDQGSTF